MKNVLTILAFILTQFCFGQYTEDLSDVRPTYKLKEDTLQKVKSKKQHPDSIRVKIEKISDNKEVDSVTNVLAEQNLKAPYNQTKGYRVQVYSGDDKLKAEEIKTQLDELEILNEVATYKLFESGYIWRVKVGDFQTRIEAYRVYKQLKDEFPNCLLVPERKINLK